jgi:hypothetical protein
VSGDKTGFNAILIHNPPSRYGRGQNRWLRNLGQPKLIFGTFKAKRGELVTERLVSLFKCLPGYGILFGKFFAHANGLRSLAGKKKRDGTNSG